MEDDFSGRLARLEQQQRQVEGYLRTAIWPAMDAAYDVSLPNRSIACIACYYSAEYSSWEKLIDECRFGGGKLERYRCPNCECVFGPQKYLDMSDEFVASDWRLAGAGYGQRASLEEEVRTFRSLKSPDDGVFMQWGNDEGVRWTVDELRRAGYDAYGFNPGHQSETPFLVSDEAEISATFDGIFSSNVIQHFRRPEAEFRNFHRRLKAGGRMAHATPCYEYVQSDVRFHTLFLLGRSADMLAERTGFRILDREQDGSYMNIVFEKI